MTRALTYDDLESVFSDIRQDIERMLRRRVQDPHLAADLTQETFLRISRITQPLPDRDQARRYLFSIAKNLATDHQKVEGRRDILLENAAALFEDYQPSPEDSTIATDQMRIVQAALDELPKHCREVLFMSRVLGMSHGEIATELKVSRSLVEKYVVRAVLHCRARLQAQ